MASALDNVLAQAQDAANNFTPPTPGNGAGLPVPVAANQNALAKPALDSFIDSGGMTVDEFIQVKPEGIRLGKDFKGLLDDVEVEINMLDVVPIYSARAESGGKSTFIKSYDGITTPEGRNFATEMARLQATNTKFDGPYQSAEIPMELVADVKDPKSALVLDSGTTVGLTTSITGFKNFQKFCKKLRQEDPSLLHATLKVKLVHEKRTNSNNNEWGVVAFELIERLD